MSVPSWSSRWPSTGCRAALGTPEAWPSGSPGSRAIVPTSIPRTPTRSTPCGRSMRALRDPIRAELDGGFALVGSRSYRHPFADGGAGGRSAHRRRGRVFLVGSGLDLPHPHRGELAGASMDQVRARRDPPLRPVVLRADERPAVIGPWLVPRRRVPTWRPYRHGGRKVEGLLRPHEGVGEGQHRRQGGVHAGAGLVLW